MVLLAAGKQMTWGLIARNDCSGLGIQTYEMYAHLHPDKILEIDVSDLYNKADNCNKRRVFTYPDAQVIKGWHPTTGQINEFLDGLDVVYSAETFYTWDLVRSARERGIRTLLHVNPEFCDHIQNTNLPRPDLFCAPGPWLWDQLPEPKILLPVPVATERFQKVAPEQARGQPQSSQALAHRNQPTAPYGNHSHATAFLHVAGRPAVKDRGGTTDVLRALPHVKSEITITFRCLLPGYIDQLVRATQVRLPANVEMVVEENDVDCYEELYEGQDVLVAPRRFAGLSLPCQEAMAAGMPVIFGAHDVYAQAHARRTWAVPSRKVDRLLTRVWIDVFEVDPRMLAAKIDEFATDATLFVDGQAAARDWAHRHSWDSLKPRYVELLEGVEVGNDSVHGDQ